MGELDIELGRLQRAFGMVSAACAACNAWRRWSTTCSETALVWNKVQPAIEVALGELRLGPRIGKLAVGLAATASNGRGSMM